MSTNYFNPRVTESVKVMVRAFGDEPVVLRAIGADAQSVEVIGDNESKSLSFPRAYVYEWEPRYQEELESAYRDEDINRLEKLWKDAKPFRWK